MSWIDSVALEVGRRSVDKQEFARVSCRLHFSPTEIQLNPWFTVRAILVDIHDDLDAFIPIGEGKVVRIKRGAGDDWIDPFQFVDVRPDGAAYKDLVLENDWSLSSQGPGDEHYVAVVFATPEICASTGKSNEVAIDLR